MLKHSNSIDFLALSKKPLKIREGFQKISLFLGLMLFLLMTSCAQQEQKSIGDRINAPFDILRIEKWDEFLVLSSAFDGTYKDGNLLRLRINDDGSYEKRQTLALPRLGARLAKNLDESLVAIAFSQENPQIKFFALDSNGLNPNAVLEFGLEGSRVVSDMSWFKLTVAGVAREFLAVERTGNSKTARVDIFEFKGTELQKLFTFPDDLPGARNQVYELGHSSPVFLPNQGLLVFFPNAGAGIRGEFPSPFDVLTSGKWPVPDTQVEAKKAPADLRLASLAAVDLQQYFATNNLAQSSYFYPLMFNDSLKNGNKDLPPDDPANSTLKFRSTFTEATLAKSDSCSSVAGGAPADVMLVGQFDSGNVLAISGWADFKAEIEKLKQASEKPEERLILKGLSIAPYSIGSGANGLPSSSLRVSQITSQNVEGVCYPFVVRADVKLLEDTQTNAGRENVWLSHAVGRDPADPVVTQLPERSAIRFAGKDKNLFFISFSKNSLTQVQFLDNQFTIGQTRSE